MDPLISADELAYAVGHVSTHRFKNMLSLSSLLPLAMLKLQGPALRWALRMTRPITGFLSSSFTSPWLLSAHRSRLSAGRRLEHCAS